MQIRKKKLNCTGDYRDQKLPFGWELTEVTAQLCFLSLWSLHPMWVGVGLFSIVSVRWGRSGGCCARGCCARVLPCLCCQALYFVIRIAFKIITVVALHHPLISTCCRRQSQRRGRSAQQMKMTVELRCITVRRKRMIRRKRQLKRNLRWEVWRRIWAWNGLLALLICVSLTLRQ